MTAERFLLALLDTPDPERRSLRECAWEEIELDPATQAGGNHIERFALVIDHATKRARIEVKGADLSLLVTSGELADAIALGRPLLPKLLAVCGQPAWAALAAARPPEARATLESVTLHRLSARVEYDVGWEGPGLSGYRARVKVGRGEDRNFDLDLALVEQAARSATSPLRPSLSAHALAMDFAQAALPELLPAVDADAVADASDRDDLPSRRKPPL